MRACERRICFGEWKWCVFLRIYPKFLYKYEYKVDLGVSCGTMMNSYAFLLICVSVPHIDAMSKQEMPCSLYHPRSYITYIHNRVMCAQCPFPVQWIENWFFSRFILFHRELVKSTMTTMTTLFQCHLFYTYSIPLQTSHAVLYRFETDNQILRNILSLLGSPSRFCV